MLRTVRAGENVEVTNHGETAAVLVLPSLSKYDRPVAAGKVRLPADQPVDLRRLRRGRSRLPTPEILGGPRRPVIVYVDTSAAMKLAVEEAESTVQADRLERTRAAGATSWSRR